MFDEGGVEAGRSARYPGLALLVFFTLVSCAATVFLYLNRDGSRATDCGGFDCTTTITGDVPIAAVVVSALISAVLIAAVATFLVRGRSVRS